MLLLLLIVYVVGFVSGLVMMALCAASGYNREIEEKWGN